MSGFTVQEQALQYFNMGYRAQTAGHYDEAIALYRKSIELHPTAKAHTFLGWAYSFRDDLDEAIAECKRAIALDPDFGNPYNDIGAYLIRRRQHEEAIPWLEMACKAPDYEARHYAYFNLGFVYERLGEARKAIRFYKRAGKINPRYTVALQAAERLSAQMN